MISNGQVVQHPVTEIKPISYTDIKIGGELNTRLQKNFDRLESQMYSADKVFPSNENTQSEWPGDIEGRLMLGLVLDAQATHREPKYLAEMVHKLPEKLNKNGYFGSIQKDIITEQQLSGNGWFLRALCEYYLWKRDPTVKGYIQTIINNLVLPTKGYHANYPIVPEERKKNIGGASGTTQATIGRWKLSSDIGCDFIFLDGVVQAYQIIPSTELKDLIDEMITRFLQIDLKKMNMQTHATLTGVRALLRYYMITKKPYLLKEAEQHYLLYRSNATTANFENFNWFGRPEWTEPCAVVDSYMVSVQLWQLSNKPVYLEDAHHIYYNGLGYDQHGNGGFGLSNCTIPGNNSLKVIENEAWWCCTMRGAEGLGSTVRYNYFIDDNQLIIPIFNNSEATIHLHKKWFTIKQTSAYPFEGIVSMEVINSSDKADITMKLAAPSWTKNHMLLLNGKVQLFKLENGFIKFKTRLSKGAKIELTFDQKTSTLHQVNNEYSKPNFYTFNYGPLVLGYNNTNQPEISFTEIPDLTRLSKQDWVIKEKNIHLSPVYHLLDPDVNKESGSSKQILFEIGSTVPKVSP